MSDVISLDAARFARKASPFLQRLVSLVRGDGDEEAQGWLYAMRLPARDQRWACVAHMLLGLVLKGGITIDDRDREKFVELMIFNGLTDDDDFGGGVEAQP